MTRRPLPRLACACGLAFGLAALAAARDLPQGIVLRPMPGEEATIAQALPVADEPAQRPLLVVEAARAPDAPETLASVIEAAAGRARVVVELADLGPCPTTARDPAWLEAWLAFVTRMAETSRGRVAAWVIADSSIRYGSPSDDLFAFKRTVLALRAVEPDAVLAWRAGAVASDAADRCPALASTDTETTLDLESLWPFVDAVVRDSSGVSALSQRVIDEMPPSIAQWGWSWLGDHGRFFPQPRVSIMLPLARAMPAAFLPVVVNQDEAAEAGRTIAMLQRAIPAEAEAIPGGMPIRWPDGIEIPAFLLVVPSDLSHRLVFGPAPPEVRRQGAFVIARLQDDGENLRLHDPDGKLDGPVESTREPGRITAVKLPIASRCLVLAWDRPASGEEVKADAAVAGEHEPTLEEILARHAERRAQREHAVDTWSADLTTTMRYQLGQSGRSIEVRIESRYYERADGLKEIENLEFFIDGAPYSPKKGKPPELPLIQPEKVTIVPLEIQLDKSYEYELRGKAIRGGSLAWRLAFRPVDDESAAWGGTAWIDAKTYDLLATDLVQSGLEPPILSNQQLESYGAVPSGTEEAWLVREIDTRRVMSILGSNVVVDIAMKFSNAAVNAPEFDARLAEARDSERQMLRDTDEGLKYLRKDESGQRVPMDASPRKLFFIAGARADESYEAGVIPLAGVNWLNNDAWGRGLQVNAFIAGAINDISISDPSLWGSKTNLTFEAFVPLVRQTDRPRGPDGVDEDSEAAVREPRLSVGIGRPIGSFTQVGFETRLSHQGWSDTDDTVSGFQVPDDTLVVAAIGTFEVHAGQWDARTAVERAERTSWEKWGPVDMGGEPTIESAAGYWRWRASLRRTFRPTALQSVRLEGEYLGGDDLDRFSQYEFSAFGGPDLPGFSGSGIHFDEAGIVRVTWGLSLFGRLGIDVTVAAAQTRNPLLLPSEIADIGFSSRHVGVGLGGTVPGPWRTLVRFDLGAPVSSPDYDDLGSLTAQVLFTKLLR